MYMCFIFCVSSRPEKTVRQIRTGQEKRKLNIPGTVNIGLNFEGVRQRYCKNTYR